MTVPKFCKNCGQSFIGSEFVTLSNARYNSLLEGASRPVQKPLKVNRFRFVGRTTIARKPELAEFIFECAQTMTTDEIREACLKKYGDISGISRSAIHRFVSDVSDAFYNQ